MHKKKLFSARRFFASTVVSFSALWPVQKFACACCLPLEYLLAQRLLIILAVLGRSDGFSDVISQILPCRIVLPITFLRALLRWECGKHFSLHILFKASSYFVRASYTFANEVVNFVDNSTIHAMVDASGSSNRVPLVFGRQGDLEVVVHYCVYRHGAGHVILQSIKNFFLGQFKTISCLTVTLLHLVVGKDLYPPHLDLGWAI